MRNPVPVPAPATAAAVATPADAVAAGYRAGADAPATLRAYRADLACLALNGKERQAGHPDQWSGSAPAPSYRSQTSGPDP